MAILRIKQLIEQLKAANETVTVGKASSAGHAGTAYFAESV